jgi:hypothetical protein
MNTLSKFCFFDIYSNHSSNCSSDHPQARFQKRQMEEKGAFGKSNRQRFGSTRGTRTQTPAKKENPTIDGFAAALQWDQKQKQSEEQAANNTAASATENPSQTLPSLSKEPQQLILYGFAPEHQWAAISFYERVSGGIICEDYPRDPPAEKRKFHNGLAQPGNGAARRRLTSAELALCSQYHGGASWIVVTFDSHEAADRAMAASPHLIQGYNVVAEPWRGIGPEDRTLPAIEDSGRAKSATLASGLGGRRQSNTRQSVTLSKGFKSYGEERQPTDAHNEVLAIDDSATMTSATATAAEDPKQSGLRNRFALVPVDSDDGTLTVPQPPQTQGRDFRHFPGTPRTMLKPASEALLPQPSWLESLFKSLTASGWIPGDFIGTTVPRNENGDFDWDSSSLWWRFCYWIDSVLGSDLCGLKEG